MKFVVYSYSKHLLSTSSIGEGECSIYILMVWRCPNMAIGFDKLIAI